jgi:putative addiction module component (TIGR02574 family)
MAMARSVEELEKELMALPHDERARLAHELLVSLHEEEAKLSPEQWEAEWIEEVRRREQDLREGRTRAYPTEEVMREVREKLRDGRE